MKSRFKRFFEFLRENYIFIFLFLYFVFLIILTYFRDATEDEAIYLKETFILSELIKNNIWFGDYGVGLHGFLFKVPVAILFIIFNGNYVTIATLFTIFLSICSLYLFYKIVNIFFFKKYFAFWTTVLLSVTLYFVNTSVGFYREIPVLFTVLLFMYFLLKNSNKWLIAFSLLLMLDAKEHVFLTIAPVYGFYLLLFEFKNKKNLSFLHKVGKTFKNWFVSFGLSLLWIILMFTTSIVPMNMFLASTLGLTSTGMSWNKLSFSPKVAVENIAENGKEIFQLTNIESISSEIEEIEKNEKNENTTFDRICSFVVKSFDTFLSYVGKVLYPRTFSFISIPKIIVLPSLIMAFSQFFIWFKKRDPKYILPMIMCFNVAVVIIRASHGRYLLSIAPLFALFFVMFLKEGIKNHKYFRNTLMATTIFVILGLLFESSFVVPKVILEISLLVIFWCIWFFRNRGEKTVNILKFVFLGTLSSSMLLTTLVFSYSIGQISNYLKYGYNRETERIAREFKQDEMIWINEFGSVDLIKIYRGDLSNDPEWVWELNDKVPKRSLLKELPGKNTFSLSAIPRVDIFKQYIIENNIAKIAILASSVEGNPFKQEEFLTVLYEQTWLEKEEPIKLENKILYVFDVKD
ncbi:MAG: hypothetical protein AB9915_00770 [Candidatus Dojkabacteria bacterium]